MVAAACAVSWSGPVTRLTIVGDGDSALDLLHKGGVDVILIDLHLRQPSALDIVRMYRFMRSEDAHLPIVGLAPGLTDSMRKRCISAGMNEVLPMPVEGFRLLEAVDRLGAASCSARQALETGVIASISSHPRFSAVAEPSTRMRSTRSNRWTPTTAFLRT